MKDLGFILCICGAITCGAGYVMLLNRARGYDHPFWVLFCLAFPALPLLLIFTDLSRFWKPTAAFIGGLMVFVLSYRYFFES